MTLVDRYEFGDREHLAVRMVECVAETPSERHFADQDDPCRALLRILHSGEGFIDVRALHVGRPAVTLNVPAGKLEEVERFAARHPERNIFFGVASRRTSGGRDTDACSELRALFADLDFKDFKQFTDPEAEARSRLKAFPLPPSVVIVSGGGLQCYWLLAEPLSLQGDGAANAKDWLRRLATLLGADLNAAEPARILRVPGSRNFKYDPPRDVVIESFYEVRRYSIEDFASVLPPAAETESTRPSEPMASGVAEGSRNNALFKEGCRLRRLGWSGTEIRASLLTLNAERCRPPLPMFEVEEVAASCSRYEPEADTFPPTEAGDAEHFVTCNGDSVRYDHRAKRWLIFREHHWAEQTTGDVHRLALDSVRARQRAAVGNKERLRWALGGESRTRQGNLLALAENMKPVADDGDNWDADPSLLGVQNGVIDLRTGVLRDGRPEDRITLASPFAYDPRTATAKWKQFVLDVCNGDRELADYFQVVFGYGLTGETGEQCFWIFYGLGSNGKSTLLEVLTKHVIPRHSWTMKFPSTKWSESMSDYQRAQLVGKRLIVSKENERTQRLNTEFIKSLTGDEEIEARHPYGRPFNFSPVAKFIMAVNHKPIILDETHAMWRRVRMVPFLRTFALNPTFAESLIAEASAALTWAVEGAVRYYAKGIATPASVLNATTEYRKESDALAPFFEARCVLDENKKVRAQHLFDALRDFYDKRQTPAEERLSQKELGQRMAADGRFAVKNGEGTERRTVFYHGIGLIDTIHVDGAGVSI